MSRPVVVVGGGIAGLVAARRLVLAGRDVVLLERSPDFGGRVARGVLAGLPVDTGAESFATRGGTVAALADRLGLGDRLVAPERGGAWVLLADRAAPLPDGGVLGVPAWPLAPDVVRVLGRRGAARAHLDRLLPPLKIGRYEHLGPLVRGRMGPLVLDRLVSPVVESVYGADPETLPVDAIAPQLNAAVGATGSLSAAVVRLRARMPAGSAVQSLEGGVHSLAAALVEQLRRQGADLRPDTSVLGLGEDGHAVTTADGTLDAEAVVLAVDGAAAFDLLEPLVPSIRPLARPRPHPTRAVLLAVDDRTLDVRPRGSGVLRARERSDVRASALTHVTAKWGWASAPGRHVLRLSYRGEAEVPDERVLADARALLGLPIAAPHARLDRVWRDTAPALAAETRAVAAALSGALPAGVAVTGSWIDGTGLAAVVAGGARAADEVLRSMSTRPDDPR